MTASRLDRADVAAAAGLAGPDPADAASLLALLRGLYATGRRDLPLGRLVEGHVDALQIVHRYAAPARAAVAAEAAARGAVFGVWNADWPGDPLRLDDGGLHGGKAFASGAGIVDQALVSVDADGGRQLLLIDVAATPGTVDRDWWRVVGMQRSETHRVRWTGERVAADAAIGAPGDYVREPWFSGGALRFAAVQAGGIAGVVDRVRDHLVAAGRAGDPLQAARLADLYGHAQAAADAVRRAAEGWPDVGGVSAARVAVARAGDAVIPLAQAAVGLAGMFLDHPLAAMVQDLAVYLRQPAPDAQRLIVGAAVADARLAAML